MKRSLYGLAWLVLITPLIWDGGLYFGALYQGHGATWRGYLVALALEIGTGASVPVFLWALEIKGFVSVQLDLNQKISRVSKRNSSGAG